jgi:hypothetical protein
MCRTFPNHVFYHQRQGPGQRSLYHVLRAYAAHDAQVCPDMWCYTIVIYNNIYNNNNNIYHLSIMIISIDATAQLPLSYAYVRAWLLSALMPNEVLLCDS